MDTRRIDGVQPVVTFDLLKSWIFSGSDKSTVGEAAIFQELHGAAGRAMLAGLVVDIIPDNGKYHSLDQVSSGLEALKKGALYRLCNVAGRAPLDGALEICTTMAGGDVPTASEIHDDEFLDKARESLQWSFKHVGRDSKGKEKISYGLPGLTLTAAKLAQLHADSKLSFDDLTDAMVYQHLLDHTQKSELETWKRASVGAVTTGSKRKAAPAAGKPKKAAKSAASSSQAISEASDKAAILAAKCFRVLGMSCTLAALASHAS